MSEKLRGAVIEIIERTTDPDPDFIIPNAVRINGQELLVTDEPIIVDRIEASGANLVLVTIKLIARRVVIGAEPDGTVIRDAAGNIVRIIKDPE